MNIRNLIRIVFFIISVMYSVLLPNAFSDESTRWGLPTGAKARFGKSRINDIKYFPDGNKIAVATTIGTWIYDVHSGDEIDLLTEHTGYVSSVAFSHDGKIFATGSGDNTVRLWDTQIGQNISTLVGHTGSVVSIAFSPKGQILASGSHDDTIQLWNFHTGEPLKTLRGHAGGVYCVAFSPDGETIASGARDSHITILEHIYR